MKPRSLEQHVHEMSAMAKLLVPYTFPQVSPIEEQSVDCLKQRNIIVDGYDIVVRLNRADYQVCLVESLEIMSVHTPFLPMYLVCKVAAKFLGGHELKYAESFKKGRKVYIWTVAIDDRGRPIPLTNPDLIKKSYEDFNYSCTDSELL